MEIPLRYYLARIAARMRPRRGAPAAQIPRPAMAEGISVIIPSRNGKELLRAQLCGIQTDLAQLAAETIVVDNGSDDGTAQYLRAEWPAILVEESAEPLSFARAVNRGIARARYSQVCLLNNDMLIEPGFFAELGAAFDKVPDLFCATAQIHFPPGVRREETGKAVMAQSSPEDFPLRCDDPIPGEDLTWVLYGSGGCSLYDTAKLHALGNLDEVYEPAYVEDLDVGFRAWQRGWPSVYVDHAVVEHRHRATTSRYYKEDELQRIMEINYLRFLARTVADGRLFRKLWDKAVLRLKLRAAQSSVALDALRAAPSVAIQGGPANAAVSSEASFLALTDGSVAVFPGRQPSGKPRMVVATPSITRRKHVRNDQHDQVMVAFAEDLRPPPSETLADYIEVVLIRRAKGRDGNAASFRAALRQSVRKWRPAEAGLEAQGMAEYAAECAPARIILTN